MAPSICSMQTSHQTGHAVLPAQALYQPTDVKISNPAPVHTVQASSQLLGGTTHAHHQVAPPICSMQTSHQTGQAVLPAQALCQPTNVKISNPVPVHTLQTSSQLLGASTLAHHQMAVPVSSVQTSHQPAGDLRLPENGAYLGVPMGPYNFQAPNSTVPQVNNFREQFFSRAAVDGTTMRGALSERSHESPCPPNPHAGVSSGGFTSVVPNSSYFPQHYVPDARLGVSNFRAPTLQLHPCQFMQHNKLDAPPGGMYRNYSGVPRPFLPSFSEGGMFGRE